MTDFLGAERSGAGSCSRSAPTRQRAQRHGFAGCPCRNMLGGMARRTVGPRRSDSLRTYVRTTRIIGGLSVLILSGAVVWDIVSDAFWVRHTLFTGLVASLIVVAVTVAALNEVIAPRQRQRWSVLAQYALFDLVRTARLVWAGLLELAGLVPDGEFEDRGLAAGSEAVLDTPRLAAAIDEMLASADRREQLHRLIARLRAHGQEVLGRWADVMVNSGTYAETDSVRELELRRVLRPDDRPRDRAR